MVLISILKLINCSKPSSHLVTEIYKVGLTKLFLKYSKQKFNVDSKRIQKLSIGNQRLVISTMLS